jgi:glycosyltransferase involved in cell wall biosynthesis
MPAEDLFPRVTVVVPVFKGGALARRAVQSLLAQTYGNLEILVIDDGSPLAEDASLGEQFGARIRFVAQPNTGLCGALNRALFEIVRTPLVARLDQDDWSAPERIETQVKTLLDSGAIACFTRLHKVTESGRVMAIHPLDSAATFAYDPACHGCIAHSTLLARTDILRGLGGYDAELYPCDDFDLSIRLWRAGRVVVCGAPLVRYLVHDEGNTFSHFWDMELKTRYVLAKLRDDQPVPPFAQWRTAGGKEAALGVMDRVQGLGRMYYRRAGIRIGNGRWLRGGAYLLAALLLNPRFFLRRIAHSLALRAAAPPAGKRVPPAV